MNFFDQTYLTIGIVLSLPMMMVALLNWALRNHGGFARGWTGAIFVGICWVASMVVIVLKARSG